MDSVDVKDKQLATRVTPEVKTAFRVEAAKRDMDMSDLLRELIHAYLDEQGVEIETDESGNRSPATLVAE